MGVAADTAPAGPHGIEHVIGRARLPLVAHLWPGL